MLYAAYGSNLNEEQMRKRCPDAVYIGKAYVKDYTLVFRKSKTGSYLSIDKSEGGEAPAVVFWISEEDKKTLDKKEGAGLEECYKRLWIPPDIITKSGKTSREENVLTYALPEDRPEGMPEDEYVSRVKTGYMQRGFNSEPLEKAIKRANDNALL
ncbi:MAG: gamma-glutamylcyclotransferase [Abditibacteriota bacterium]|nr:gamma-glutamylcyclotransferase [Abditibacteriota bacterium]